MNYKIICSEFTFDLGRFVAGVILCDLAVRLSASYVRALKRQLRKSEEENEQLRKTLKNVTNNSKKA